MYKNIIQKWQSLVRTVYISVHDPMSVVAYWWDRLTRSSAIADGPRDASCFVHGLAMWSQSCDEWVFSKWAWSGSRERFLRCGLKKFRHRKSSVYRWYPQLDRRRFVYDTYKTMKATRTRQGWVHVFITHRPFDLFRTCRTSSFCTFAWQLARFQLTRRIAQSLGDSWASCCFILSSA